MFECQNHLLMAPLKVCTFSGAKSRCVWSRWWDHNRDCSSTWRTKKRWIFWTVDWEMQREQLNQSKFTSMTRLSVAFLSPKRKPSPIGDGGTSTFYMTVRVQQTYFEIITHHHLRRRTSVYDTKVTTSSRVHRFDNYTPWVLPDRVYLSHVKVTMNCIQDRIGNMKNEKWKIHHEHNQWSMPITWSCDFRYLL